MRYKPFYICLCIAPYLDNVDHGPAPFSFFHLPLLLFELPAKRGQTCLEIFSSDKLNQTQENVVWLITSSSRAFLTFSASSNASFSDWNSKQKIKLGTAMSL